MGKLSITPDDELSASTELGSAVMLEHFTIKQTLGFGASH